MALKDLTTSKASMAEEVIEEIISDYVRYDPDELSVEFTHEAVSLSVKAKVLVFLVALQGWSFVVDEVVATDAKPADIEEATGIAGGTLRPVLKQLKDSNIIVEKGGRYSVRAIALRTIKAELDGASTSKPTRRKKNKPKRADDREVSKHETSVTDEATKSPKRSSTTTGVGERFNAMIGEGFFDQPKTLADVQKQFHKEAVLVPQTSIPGYLLKAVRGKVLERDKEEVGGKQVWVYQKKQK